MSQETMLAVRNILREKGYSVEIEHPGYLNILSATGDRFAFGTMNGKWDGSRLRADDQTGPFFDLGFSDKSQDAYAIARAIDEDICYWLVAGKVEKREKQPEPTPEPTKAKPETLRAEIAACLSMAGFAPPVTAWTKTDARGSSYGCWQVGVEDHGGVWVTHSEYSFTIRFDNADEFAEWGKAFA